MARWQALGLMLLVTGCSLNTGPNGSDRDGASDPQRWVPARAPAAHDAGTRAERAASAHDAAAEGGKDTKDPTPPSSTEPKTPADAAAPSGASAMSPTPAQSNADPATAGAKPGSSAQPQAATPNRPSGDKADADKDKADSDKPQDADKDKPETDKAQGDKPQAKPGSGSSSQPQNGSDHAQSSSPGPDGRGGESQGQSAEGAGPAANSGTEPKSEPSAPDTSSAAGGEAPSQGALVLLFDSIFNLVLSIVEFSFGPARPAAITQLVASIVTLASLPAGELTTSALADLLDQVDASNVCHDDRSACEALCDTLASSCALYVTDPHSVRSVERNCGLETVAACKK